MLGLRHAIDDREVQYGPSDFSMQCASKSFRSTLVCSMYVPYRETFLSRSCILRDMASQLSEERSATAGVLPGWLRTWIDHHVQCIDAVLDLPVS